MAFDLRIICKTFLDRKRLNVTKFSGNMPGEDWAKSFLKRHSTTLSERISQNIKVFRASVGHKTITSYFSNLKAEIDGLPLSNIVNYDETNLTDDPGKKIIVMRGNDIRLQILRACYLIRKTTYFRRMKSVIG